jgi:hypothetical protein
MIKYSKQLRVVKNFPLFPMKTKVFASIFLLLACLLSCNKKQQDDTSQPVPQACRLLSKYYNTDSVSTFHYDSQGRLLSRWDMFEQSQYQGSHHYVYQNNRVIYDRVADNDTTFFTYDNLGRITYTQRNFYPPLGGIYHEFTVFIYDQQNQVINRSLHIVETGSFTRDQHDSTIYTWSNQNISSSVRYAWNKGEMKSRHRTDYTYDNGRNYRSGTGEPPVIQDCWNKNNVVVWFNDSLYTYTDTIKQYNASGFPLMKKSVESYTQWYNYYCY